MDNVPERTRVRVDSIGACKLCDYEGPGPAHDCKPRPDGFDITISSSWIVGHGDVIAADARRANGKKIKPRKKRGKPISEASWADQVAKADRAREIRRNGFVSGKRA